MTTSSAVSLNLGLICKLIKMEGGRGNGVPLPCFGEDGANTTDSPFHFVQTIWQAGVVAKTGRNTILLKLPAGEYLQRFGVALRRLATL